MEAANNDSRNRGPYPRCIEFFCFRVQIGVPKRKKGVVFFLGGVGRSVKGKNKLSPSADEIPHAQQKVPRSARMKFLPLLFQADDKQRQIECKRHDDMVTVRHGDVMIW